MNPFNAIQSILQLVPFSEQEQNLFASKLQPKILDKKELLLKEGQVCRSLYFVNKGALRHYMHGANGDEVSCNFFIEHNWALDMESFVSQKPSKGFIECYSDAELLELNMHDLHSLIEVSQNFLVLASLMNSCIRDTAYDTMISPEEKYQYLLSRKPELLQQFSLKHIASYLRIAPETLSRVRRKMMQA